MSAEKIASLLVGETQAVNIRVPKKLLDTVCAAMLKQRPDLARKKRGLITEALLHFAAYGFICESERGTVGAESAAWAGPMIVETETPQRTPEPKPKHRTTR